MLLFHRLRELKRHMDDRDVIRDSQHGFTKGKSCLTNLMAFYNGVTALVNMGTAPDTVCVGTVLYNILVAKVGR